MPLDSPAWSPLRVEGGEVRCLVGLGVLRCDVYLSERCGSIVYRGCGVHGSGGLIGGAYDLLHVAAALRRRSERGEQALLWLVWTARHSFGIHVLVEDVIGIALEGEVRQTIDAVLDEPG